MSFHKKVTDDQILVEYKKSGSVWKTGHVLGICGQSVHERLIKLNMVKRWRWTEDEDALLIDGYGKAGNNKTFLSDLVILFGREKSCICARAKKLGLTKQSRKHSQEQNNRQSEITKKQIAENGHPKGMLGKVHTDEMKAKMKITSTKRSDSMSQKQWDDRTVKSNATRKTSGKKATTSENAFCRTVSGKRKDLDQFFRSRTEANYARFLNHCRIEWVYEPKTFFFPDITRGALSYTPDFYCPKTDKWYEVKGWMDGPSSTRLKRFKKHHPVEAAKLVIVAQSKATFEKSLAMGFDVVRYEDIEKKYNHLPCWE